MGAIEKSSIERKEQFHRILLVIYVHSSHESYRGVENSSAPSTEHFRIVLELLLLN